METAADRLINNPDFREVVGALAAEVLRDMESLVLDGSRDCERHAAELCRKYQLVREMERSLWTQRELEKLKPADQQKRERYAKAGIPAKFF